MLIKVPAGSELFKKKAKFFWECSCLDTLSLVAHPVVQGCVPYRKVIMHRNVGFELVVVHHPVIFVLGCHKEKSKSFLLLPSD